MDSGPFTIPDDDPVVLEIEGRSGLLSPKTPQAPTHSAHPISAADFFMSDCVFSPPKRTPSGLLRDATSLLPHRPHQVRLSMNAYGISPGIRNYATSTNPTLSNNTNSNNNSTAKISFLNELFDEEEDIMAGSPLAKQDSIPVTPIYVKQEQLGSSGARIVAPSAGSRSAYHRPDRAPPRTPVFHPPLGPNPLLSVAPSYHHSLPYSAPPTQQPMTQTATSSRHHFPGHNNAKPPSSRRANPSNDMAVELEMEKRHEYSVIKIPRREVDDLFEENVQTMPEEERRIVLPPVSTENLRWVTTKAYVISCIYARIKW